MPLPMAPKPMNPTSIVHSAGHGRVTVRGPVQATPCQPASGVPRESARTHYTRVSPPSVRSHAFAAPTRSKTSAGRIHG